MLNPVVLVLLSAICILPSLVAGAISDIRTRTFPAKYFQPGVGLSGIFTLVLYLELVAMHDWYSILLLLSISIIFAPIFYFIGVRYGSGGDYRALIYIAAT